MPNYLIFFSFQNFFANSKKVKEVMNHYFWYLNSLTSSSGGLDLKGQVLPPALTTLKAKIRSNMFLIMLPFVRTLMLNKAEKLLSARESGGTEGGPYSIRL